MLLEKQRMTHLDVAIVLDALLGRLSYDKDFAEAVTADPRATLEAAGLTLDKDAVDEFIRLNPERFNRISDALLSTVDENFLAGMGAVFNSCD